MAAAFRSFWHTMTSNDRHASHDSPHRTGQHAPLPHSRHAPLTSIATNGTESRVDLTSSYNSDGAEQPALLKSPSTQSAPYSPGMRSTMQRKQTDDADGNLSKTSSGGEIQMQNFQDGLPPAPPVAHSWKRIERWTEDHYEELFDNLGEGCTQNDINELEHELDCTLPQEVRESLQCHDGQERGGLPSGVLFGCMLLDAEEIVQEWKNWRKVNDEYLTSKSVHESPQVPIKAFAGPSAPADAPPLAKQTSNSSWQEDLQSRQDSQPSNAVAKAYAHPAWIPLARDWGGNNLAVDLAPGPAGKWGQVIIMGRDYDCKYVVARSWAALLATVADDLGSDKVFVHEESGELKLREFKQESVEPGYLDILRWRADQKYGRKGMRQKSSNGPAGPRTSSSPYSTGNSSDSERGRSKAPAGPARTQHLSPLARVSEEPVSALKTYSNGSHTFTRKDSLPIEKLISTSTTPRGSVEVGGRSAAMAGNSVMSAPLTTAPRASSPLKTYHENSFVGKENVPVDNVKGLGIIDGNVKTTATEADDVQEIDGDMRTVEI